jgi:hypothetical protein
MKTKQRIKQIDSALDHESKPRSYRELSELVTLKESHISHIVAANDGLYSKILRNKKERRINKLLDKMRLIEGKMEEDDISASYACLALGFYPQQYAKYKSELHHATGKSSAADFSW